VINVLIPMVGHSPFFPPQEFAYPRPMIEIRGKPMITWVLSNLNTISKSLRFFFVASAEDAINFSYERVFRLLTENRAETILTKHNTGGALCSSVLMIDRIPFDEQLVIGNSDQIIDADLSRYIDRFEKLDADGGVLTFQSVHPRWSYVSVEGDGFVTCASEKRVISKNAIAGFYYFRKAGDFFEAAETAINNGAMCDGKYYISASINEMILAGKKIYAQQLPRDHYVSFYHPKQIESFERSDSDLLDRLGEPTSVQVVIPAAGNGSRFAKAGYEKPKPFIDVCGKPMIARVIENMNVRNAKVTLILRKKHAEAEKCVIASLQNDGAQIVNIDLLTEGTACTVLQARGLIDNEAPLLIANSDQLIDIDINKMIDDCMERNLDGSILVFKDTERNPKWSFAKVDEHGYVTEVQEKKPISDLATVGIYFFRHGADFVDAAVDMIAKNDRVNNEFYTCPAYNYAIKNGLKIGVYELSQSQMHGIGTPEDLNRYLETHGDRLKS
jgi:dTDP-glucose pyrophosphorylase